MAPPSKESAASGGAQLPSSIADLLERAKEEGARAVADARDLASLEGVRNAVLGRKAPLSRARSQLGGLQESDRRELGRRANDVHRHLVEALERKQSAFQATERRARWEEERVDVTLPGTELPVGALHPLTATLWEIVDIFVGLGYRLAGGPEVELSTLNFDALNTPFEHPSRSPSDTYFIEGEDEEVCLRTHTSPGQIRAMQAQQPPLYIVVPGRSYRRDVQDPTHLSGFTQLEGLAIDEGISMGDLKGTLEAFAGALFGKHLDVRLRPHFFPFTEPSAEMDVQCFVCRGAGCRVCKQEGWIEVLGAGMVDPFLLEWVGYDTERYTGFAFGMGIERVAALAHGVPDIRYFYENDIRFLEPFKGVV